MRQLHFDFMEALLAFPCDDLGKLALSQVNHKAHDLLGRTAENRGPDKYRDPAAIRAEVLFFGWLKRTAIAQFGHPPEVLIVPLVGGELRAVHSAGCQVVLAVTDHAQKRRWLRRLPPENPR